MQKSNFFKDNNDLVFHLENLNYDSFFSLMSESDKAAIECNTPLEFKDYFLQLLDQVGEVCANVAKNAKAVDESHLQLVDGEVVFPKVLQDNIELFVNLGIPSFSIPHEQGGLGAPFIYEMIGAELMNRACPSTMLNVSWYANIAKLILLYGTKDLIDRFVPKLVVGEFSGNMALTEPDAGSDLASLRTYAQKEDDGSYKLFGTKRFITNGNGEVSLVLAKSEKGAHGLEHLSLFVCPRHLDGKHNIKISNIEKKLGLSGSATCELVYDGAKAWLLGKENQGYKMMLLLMNESRIGVGFQGIGLMEASFEQARTYTQERKTWGKKIADHEMICEKLLDLEVLLKASRSLGIRCAYYRSLLDLGERKLQIGNLNEIEAAKLKKEIKEWDKILRNMTPLLKYWIGEKTFFHARETLTLFGGYGYCKEYQPEWLLRESVIYAIYEGTSQIQALMTVKDTIKQAINSPKRLINRVLSNVYQRFTNLDSTTRKYYQLKNTFDQALLSVLFKIVKGNLKLTLSETSKSDLLKLMNILKENFGKFDYLRPALLHAERLCELKTLMYCAKSLMEDAKKDPSRQWILERFLHTSLSRAKYLKHCIDVDDSIIAQRLDAVDSNSKSAQANVQ